MGRTLSATTTKPLLPQRFAGDGVASNLARTPSGALPTRLADPRNLAELDALALALGGKVIITRPALFARKTRATSQVRYVYARRRRRLFPSPYRTPCSPSPAMSECSAISNTPEKLQRSNRGAAAAMLG